MAVKRTPPKCPKCGEYFDGKYWHPETFFCGDTFIGWDYEGHICRLGTKYFIERTDTHQWWTESNQWTTDPMGAMIFIQRDIAKKYLENSLIIPPRINCEITEHEFVGK